MVNTPSKSGTVYIGSDEKEIKAKEETVAQKSSKEKEIDNLIKRANLIVFETTSKMPVIGPFKNKLTICPNRITLTYNSLLSKDEYPMPIENVTGARVYRDFLFGTLHIDTFGIPKPDPLKYLSVYDARLARRYILALIECKKANIELPCEDVISLRDKLKSIGMVRYSSEHDEYHQI